MRWTLRVKLALGLAGIVTVIMGLAVLLLTLSTRARLAEDYRNSAIYLSNVAQAGLENAMVSRNPAEISSVLQAIAHHEDVQRAAILDKQGEIKYTTNPQDVAQVLAIDDPSCQICHDHALTDQTQTAILQSQDGGRVLRVARPVLNQPLCQSCHQRHVLGVLITDFSLAETDRQVTATVQELFLWALLTIAGVIGVAIGFVNLMVARPLSRFLRITQSIGEGDLNQHVALTTGDEIGELAASFNRMLQRVATRTRELEALGLENAQLYARERQLAHYLRALNQAMMRAVAGLSVKTVIQTIVQCLVEQCDAAFARIWWTDESSEYLILRASAGLYTHLDGSRARVSIANDPRKLGIIARARQPLISNQVQQEPYFDSAWAKREGIVAFAGYPILANEELLGVIALFSRQALAPEMLDVLGTFVNQVAIALAKARLYEAEQRHAKRLSELQKLGVELATLHEESTILNTLVERVANLAESTTCTVIFIDAEAKAGVIAAQSGLTEAARGLRIPFALPIIRRSLETGEPILVPNIDRDAPEMRQVLVRKDINAIFAFPIMRAGRPFGYITLSSLTPHAPSTAEVNAYRLLAEIVAAGLENVRLLKELEYRVHELSTLVEVGQGITRLRLEDVLTLVAQAAPRALHAEASYLFLWDEREEHLVLRASNGLPSEDIGRIKYDLGEGLAGWVFLENKTTLVADVTQDPRWKRHPQHEGVLPAGSGRGHNALVVPLRVGEKTLGVLGVMNKVASGAPQVSIAPFTPADESLLTAIAGQTAIAIENARLDEETQRLSITDPLTGLHNRRALDQRLPEELRRAQRYLHPLSVIMADIDHFKHYNDTHGHPRGDVILRQTAEILRGQVRETDSVARYGGEEFLILLPETPKAAALQVAEKIRVAVEATRYPLAETQPGGRLTISLGVATFPEDLAEAQDLIQKADDALYSAKRTGRDRVCSA